MINKGIYKPLNPEKYIGRIDQIIYRSGLELKMMFRLDKDPNIIEWSSEEIKISYFSPLDRKWHYYFPDFYVKKQLPNKQFEISIIEIKPLNQVVKPKKKKNEKKYIKEQLEFAKNQAKWDAAKKYTKEKGWKFKIITEDDLGIKFYGR